jgi:hypothetical protein
MLLRDDGSQESPTASLGVGFGLSSAVFVGDGFLLAGDPLSRVAVRRLWLDGSLGLEQQPFPRRAQLIADYTLGPSLAWTGSEARLTFHRTGSPEDGLYWTRLDANGALIDCPHPIGMYGGAPVVMLGSDMVLLTEVGNGNVQVGTRRVLADGGAAFSLTPVGFSQQFVAQAQLIEQGTTLFAAWFTQAAPSSYLNGAGGRAVLAKVQ